MERVWLWVDTLSGAEFLALLVGMAIAQFAILCTSAAIVDAVRNFRRDY